MICYFDTSALVKIYHQEAGSKTVKALYHSATNQIVISNLAIPETFSTFQRKRREGHADNQLLEAAVHEGLSGLNPEQSI